MPSVQHVPLLNVIWRNKEVADTNVQQVLTFMSDQGLDGYRPPVDERDWVIRHEPALGTAPGEWMALCRQFMNNVQSLESASGRQVFHVFFNGPAALALAMGATLGTRYPLILYHWQGRVYHPVMDFSTGEALMHLKSRLNAGYEFLTVKRPARWTQDTVVALRLIASSPASFISTALDENVTALVTVDNLYEDVLALDMDWARIAHEAADVVRQTLSQSPVGRVHLSFGCPVALAFAIGMALDFKSAVRVYHWFADEQNYEPVAELNKLRASPSVQYQALESIFDLVKTARIGRFEWLHRTLGRIFDIEELKTLCTYIDVDYDDLRAENKTGMIRELILYLERRNRLRDLIDKARALRPNESWEEIVS